jgi:hypothetical protein
MKKSENKDIIFLGFKMYVKNLKKGDIYRPKKNSFLIEYSGKLYEKQWFIKGKNYPKNLTFMRIITSKEKAEHSSMLYLGNTHDNWAIHGCYKHHWFFMDNEIILLANHSIKHLETLDG